MFRTIRGLYPLIVVAFLLSIPLGEVAGRSFDQIDSEPDSTGAAGYELDLPLVVTPVDERIFLMAVYNSTGGENWFNHGGWNTDSPYCEWYGVACDAVWHVTGLDLGGNGLTGT